VRAGLLTMKWDLLAPTAAAPSSAPAR
jgi:hypothetical protein